MTHRGTPRFFFGCRDALFRLSEHLRFAGTSSALLEAAAERDEEFREIKVRRSLDPDIRDHRRFIRGLDTGGLGLLLVLARLFT